MSEFVWFDPNRYQSIFQLAVALNLGLSVFKQLMEPHERKFKQRIELVKDDFKRLAEAGCWHIENSSKSTSDGARKANSFKNVVILTKSGIDRSIERAEKIISDAMAAHDRRGMDAVLATLLSLGALLLATFLDQGVAENPTPEQLSSLKFGARGMKAFILIFVAMVYAPFIQSFFGWIIPITRLSLILRELESARDYLRDFIVDELVER